jgi:hypothetical protein
LATQQAKSTFATLKGITKLLNHAAATHPDAEVRFRASDMVSHIDNDASHLSEYKAHSRAASCHCLSSHPDKLQGKPPAFCGSVSALCSIMREIVSSTAEAELGALFHNGREARPIRATLEEMGHPQPPTIIETGNNAAAGIINDFIKQKWSKAMDMRFHWMRDRVRQGQFHILWHKGAFNKADCFSKHHSTAHH